MGSASLKRSNASKCYNRLEMDPSKKRADDNEPIGSKRPGRQRQQTHGCRIRLCHRCSTNDVSIFLVDQHTIKQLEPIKTIADDSHPIRPETPGRQRMQTLGWRTCFCHQCSTNDASLFRADRRRIKSGADQNDSGRQPPDETRALDDNACKP